MTSQSLTRKLRKNALEEAISSSYATSIDFKPFVLNSWNQHVTDGLHEICSTSGKITYSYGDNECALVDIYIY